MHKQSLLLAGFLFWLLLSVSFQKHPRDAAEEGIRGLFWREEREKLRNKHFMHSKVKDAVATGENWTEQKSEEFFFAHQLSLPRQKAAPKAPIYFLYCL